MPRLYWVALLVCTTCFAAGSVSAQEVPPLPLSMAPVNTHPKPAEVVMVSPHVDAEGAAPEEAIVSANLMLGYQTGIRVEAAFLRQENRSFVAEAYYGLVASRMVSGEGAGGGVRAIFRKTSHYSTNSLLFGPGLDVLAQFKNDGVVMVASTVDLAWLHGFDGGAGWETGINAGIGVGVAGSTKHPFGFGDNHDYTGDVTPLISFYTGLRY